MAKYKKLKIVTITIAIVIIIIGAAFAIYDMLKFDMPRYNGEPYTVINDGQAEFSKRKITDSPYVEYSNLDKLGRCGVAEACLDKGFFPTNKKTNSEKCTPSGWEAITYDFLEDEFLYFRTNLIGYSLTGDIDNEKNMITGTGYMYNEAISQFENKVVKYMEETGNHVMYRATPRYEADNLLPTGVQLEAYSVEDSGAGINFNVFCFNVQPQIDILYDTGDSFFMIDAEI